jgi:predicted HTH transcriptional regulator
MIDVNKIYRGFVNQSPQPKGRSSKVSAKQRRESLVSFVSKSAATTLQLSEYLNITENTVRNDIRVLIEKKIIINENPCAGKYLVKAA